MLMCAVLCLVQHPDPSDIYSAHGLNPLVDFFIYEADVPSLTLSQMLYPQIVCDHQLILHEYIASFWTDRIMLTGSSTGDTRPVNQGATD